jgi:C1A family cysteine protease
MRDTIFRFWLIIALGIFLAVVPASAMPFTLVTGGIPSGASVVTGEPGLNIPPAQASFVYQAGLQPVIPSPGLVLQSLKTSPRSPFLPNAGEPGLSAGTSCTGKGQSGGTALHISPQEEDEKIRAIQNYIRENNLSWTAGKTSVSNLTPAAYTALRGLKHPAPGTSFRVQGITGSRIPKEALPLSFDWRDNGGDFTTPAKNQGGCGSCWAFASTATFESFWERINNKPDKNPNFAEQYLVSCNTNGMNCPDGGYSSILGYFVDQTSDWGGVGTVTESDYPYTASDSGCKSLTGKARYKAPAGGSWNYLEGDCAISPVAETKQAIYTYGPLNAYVYATGNFMAYSSGIFEDPSFIDGGDCATNHVVQLVGWGHDPVKDKDYWIAKNSWGTGWGENGFFKMYTDQCRIGEGVAYLTAKPKISWISPKNGSTGGNRLVTVKGTGFNGATAVRFGTAPGTSMTILSDTRITVRSPAQAPGVVNIRVTTPYGTSALVAGDRFTYT